MNCLHYALAGRTLTWLVTGSAGFIGSHLLEFLLRHGQRVVSVDDFSTGRRDNLREVEEGVGAAAWRRHRFIEGSIADPQPEERTSGYRIVVPESLRRHGGHRRMTSACLLSAAVLLGLAAPAAGQAPASGTIERIKPSIVAVGTFERLRNPQFSFAGTGFVVGNGLLVATNDHVLPKVTNSERGETLVIAVPGPGTTAQVRAARKLASDTGADLALLKIEGTALPALSLGNAERVREGETYLFTGFPVGAVLGLFPVTHRAMIAAITPIVIPAARADQLDARAVRRLAAGSFSVFQLDGTAYPGSSGSPVYDAETGEVIGIVNSVFVKGTKESALTQPSGITYAIPAQKLKELLDRTPL